MGTQQVSGTPRPAGAIATEEDFAATRRPLLQASTLPPYCYTARDFYELEIDRIFMREWLCVGRADQVENPGDYYTLTLLGEPLVVTRDLGGEIRVLSTICRHRGTEVVQGEGNRRSFQCPYHLWTYALSGELIGAPEMDEVERFEKAQCRLPSLRVEIWEGFIFVNFDADAKPLGPRLAGVSERIKSYRLGGMRTNVIDTYDCNWNWKLMMENFMEFYHVLGLHKGTHDPMPTQLSSAEDYNGTYEHSWGVLPDPDGTLWSVTGKHSPLATIEGLTYEEQHLGQFWLIYPTLLFFLTADAMGYYRVLPQAPDRINLRIHMCVPPTTAEMKDFAVRLKAAAACLLVINDQDMWACESMQRGLSSHMAPRGRFSKWDKPVHQIARYVSDRVLDGAAPPR
ncbi:MAG: aromatic ring-hydroxylating dioxygenase subunit alpha [Candidatus Binatia bacterium]